MKTRLLVGLFAAALFAPWAPLAAATVSVDDRLARVEHRVSHADAMISVGLVAAVICALWAQNTARNPWLWFFAGLFFSAIALLVLLYKNARDLRSRHAGAAPPLRT
jgi:cation transport ATPase